MASPKAANVAIASQNSNKRAKKRVKVRLYQDREKRWVKDKNEIKKLGEQIAELSSTTGLDSFLNFPISKRTFLGLKDAGYHTPTEIQKESILLTLKGFDVLGAAKTGSGKTLAFLIPILEILYRDEWTDLDGLGALIITPVRELAYQIYNVLTKVGNKHEFAAGLLIGGNNLKFETSRLKKCNIIIGTPGRLLQHMDENPLMDCSNLKVLVLDEADRILDLGFAETMNAIFENLPRERQTLLFSATQTRSVKDLARLSLRDFYHVSVHANSQHRTPKSLEQSYIVCELHEKLNMLWSFIKSNLKQKILVFVASCKQAKYIYEIFCRMRPGMSLLTLYGSISQLRRMAIYDDFCTKEHAVLIATDIAARGLDFPSINWVVQLDCPDSIETYIHRVGRTARYESDGESLLVLLPNEEEAMVNQFSMNKIPITKIKVNPSQQRSVQRTIEALLARDVALKESAQRAFVAYIKSVFLMKDKKVFDVTKLNTDAYANSLGLAKLPRIRFLQKHEKLLKDREAKKLLDAQKQQKLARKILETQQDNQASVESSEDDPKKMIHSKTKGSKAESGLSSFNGNDAEESDDELFTVKQRPRHLDIPDDDDDDLAPLQDLSARKKHAKPPTKAALAKKILNKKIKPNQKVVFDDKGEAIMNLSAKQSSEMAKNAVESELDGGIDIDKARAIMIEEDKVDKQLYREKIKAKHKEKRLKEKERKNRHKAKKDDIEAEEDSQSCSSDEAASVDLDFLPDPDKIYGKAMENSCDDDSGQSGDEPEASDSDSGQSQTGVEPEASDSDSGQLQTGDDSCSGKSESSESDSRIPATRKRKPDTKPLLSNKRRRGNAAVSSEHIDDALDTGLSLVDDEELALHFLANLS